MINNSHFSSLTTPPHSFWEEFPIPPYPSMTHSEETEIGIVGGGITGILTAYLLSQSGRKVTLIEANEMISGVTGNTTAKLTSQHHLLYHTILSVFGNKAARLYYEANKDACDLIEHIIKKHEISCHYEKESVIVYAETEKGWKKIKKEARAYTALHIPGKLIEGNISDLPFNIKGALELPHQALFHPVRFLVPLLKEIEKKGGVLYSHTRAMKLNRATNTIHTSTGSSLKCEKIIVASHYPFNDFQGLYFPKLSISRSYVIAAKTKAPLPHAMYINAEKPTRSIRSVSFENGEKGVLLGGESHLTGKSKVGTQKHYENLADFGEKWYDIESIPYHWSAQDMKSLDEVPYIGQMSHLSKDVFVATGFNKWGMSTGALAATLFSDLLMEKENPYQELFNPLRNKLKPKDAESFVVKNAQVAIDLMAGKIKQPIKEPCDLKPGEGGLVSFKGEKAGAYRDTEGGIHVIDATCTHLGCGLNWNDAERSWDCACHGSRFSYKGDVLNGPAVKPLKQFKSGKCCKHKEEVPSPCCKHTGQFSEPEKKCCKQEKEPS